MATPRTFIIIKGAAKTLQIESITQNDKGLYRIKFKSSPSYYSYRRSDVKWIKESQWHDPQHCKVYIGSSEQRSVAEIRSFSDGPSTHWRITYSSGYVHDYLHGQITVVESCLADEVARNSFEYLKRVALNNELGKDENTDSILHSLYEQTAFIDKELAASPYLDPQQFHLRSYQPPSLIFPFGCNASQCKAVQSAFSHQISIIQGPPGTGKTQTILNIIANIILQGKTVMVVSNNNSATTNVLEKLQRYSYDFIVAPLGKRDNKEDFILRQPEIPSTLETWGLDTTTAHNKQTEAQSTLQQLQRVFTLQERQALARQEIKQVETEWAHYQQDHPDVLTEHTVQAHSSKLMTLWLECQTHNESKHTTWWSRLIAKLQWKLLQYKLQRLLHNKIDEQHLPATIDTLQASYYLSRMRELEQEIASTTQELSQVHAESLLSRLTTASSQIFQNKLYHTYAGTQRTVFTDTRELRVKSAQLLHEYPVILSTTFSARTTLPDTIYDYLIVDEASQVSIETGALALTCARNAIIVGDTLQLPNVVTAADKEKLDAIFHEFQVAPGYDSSRYSFLQSICNIIPDVPQTLLREHYRCHPRIINFCNLRYYGGRLIIMTEDHNEDDVLMAIRTVPGMHARDHYNQREIDVVLHEALPLLHDATDMGIVTPYNHQVDEFNRQLPHLEAATIHRYQGREKDTIIMSAVDDQITPFSDDPNLLNVAVSRAKKQFCVVLSGNPQELKGNLHELVEYIQYNNFTVTDSQIRSIFDYLYSHYTQQRIAYLQKSRRISEYESENLTYRLITDILQQYPEFSHLGVICHIPIRDILRDWSPLSPDEQRYISHRATHLDFLIYNRVSKQATLAIETDGYSFHHAETEQHQRDLMKDHILSLYHLPLLRLSTTGSNEHERIVTQLHALIRP